MRLNLTLLKQVICPAVVLCTLQVEATSLTTVQNRTLSTPSAAIAVAGLPEPNPLVGSNFMISAVESVTAQGGRAALVSEQQWVRRYSAGYPSYYAGGYAISVLRDGRLAVTGSSYASGSGEDFVTLCYAPDGRPLWTNRFGVFGSGYDRAHYLAEGPGGDVWVAGTSQREPNNNNSMEAVLIRYASNGIPVWTNQYSLSETNGTGAAGLVVDAAGSAYLLHFSTHWQGYSGSPTGEGVTKYNPDGTIAWIKHYPRSAPDSGEGLHSVYHLALDPAGNLFLAGDAGTSSWLRGSSLVTFSPDGLPLWTNFLPRQVMSTTRFLLVDRQGDIVLTGESNNVLTAYVILKCSAGGFSLWTNSMMGPPYNGGNMPQTVLTAAGDVFLIGGSPGMTPGYYHVLKLSREGVPLATNQHADFGPTQCMIYGSGADSAGNLYLTAMVPGSDTNYRDFLTVKYANATEPLWTNRFDGPAGRDDIPFAMAVGMDGSVYITGRSDGTLGEQEIATVKYADQLVYTPPHDFTGSDSISYTLTDELGNHATGTLQVLVMPGAFHFLPGAIQRFPHGMQLQVDGIPGSGGVALEISTNLVHWRPILTNQPANGSVQFLDPTSPTAPKRFYRAVQKQ